MFFKGHCNDGTLLQLTPDSVFKYSSVTRYWSRTVTRCYEMDWLRNKIYIFLMLQRFIASNKIMNNWKKTSLWMWRWISYRDCRNVSWQWLVTRVAWAVNEVLNSGKQFHVLIESEMEIWIRLRVLSCYMKMTSPRVSWLSATELIH